MPTFLIRNMKVKILLRKSLTYMDLQKLLFIIQSTLDFLGGNLFMFTPFESKVVWELSSFIENSKKTRSIP